MRGRHRSFAQGTVFPNLSSSRIDLASRVLSIGEEVIAALDETDPESAEVSLPSNLRARMLIWQGGGELIRRWPWFTFEDRPFPPLLHLFGYGPEFFQYLFPLNRPSELTGPQRDVIY